MRVEGPVRSFVVAESKRRRGHRNGQGRPDRGGPTTTRDRCGETVEGTSGAAVGTSFRERGSAAALRRVGCRLRAAAGALGDLVPHRRVGESRRQGVLGALLREGKWSTERKAVRACSELGPP